MKRRLRKKKHLGEFKELGFEISVGLRAEMSDDEVDVFWDALVDAVEERGLAFGGGSGHGGRLEAFVTQMGRGSTTEEDRSALAAFFAKRADVTTHVIGPLRDAWYGFED